MSKQYGGNVNPSSPKNLPPAAQMEDHRTRNAARKRVQMRARILMATMHVYADHSREKPVIDDVIKEADISRGTFYKYFESLDEALQCVGQEVSDQFTLDLLPIYDVLKEPWQRFSVGFRLFMLRAQKDAAWAAFVSRMDVWPKESLVTRYMSADLERGVREGCFVSADLQASADFLKGASLSTINAMRAGVANPAEYMNAAVRMGLASLGCSPAMCEKGMKFSERYLEEWKPRNSWTNNASV